MSDGPIHDGLCCRRIAWLKWVTCLGLIVFLSAPVWANQKAALVIGNADYEIGRLRNPVNDANDVAASLQAIGFDVVLATNAGREDLCAFRSS